MTRLSLLEDQKAILTVKKEALENKRGDIYVREQQAITDTIFPFFNEFTPEVEIEVTRGSVYFKMAHPDYSYKKELFNVYLRENWNYEEKGKSFNAVDLSYYTTSTKGVDSWELNRLRLLGKVAEIIHNHQERILLRVNNAVLTFKEEYDRVHEQMRLVGQAIRELDEKIIIVKKEKIEFDLMNEGVTFDVGVNIRLKHNYTPYIKFIKLINISKSGKTATASIIWARSEHEVQEDNVRINDVVTQVLGFRNTIIKKELAN
jgi:hypothetical protein